MRGGAPRTETQGREDPTRLDRRRACRASPERRASAMGSRHRTATDSPMLADTHQGLVAHPHGTSTGDIHRAALRVRPLGWVSLNQSRDIHWGHPPCRPARPTTEVGVPQSITSINHAGGPPSGGRPRDIHRGHPPCRPARPTTEVGVPQSITSINHRAALLECAADARRRTANRNSRPRGSDET